MRGNFGLSTAEHEKVGKGWRLRPGTRTMVINPGVTGIVNRHPVPKSTARKMSRRLDCHGPWRDRICKHPRSERLTARATSRRAEFGVGLKPGLVRGLAPGLGTREGSEPGLVRKTRTGFRTGVRNGSRVRTRVRVPVTVTNGG